jgi:hypothetical protein
MNFHPPADGRWEMQPRDLRIVQQVTLDDGQTWTVKAMTANFVALTRPVTDADRKKHREEYDEANWDSDFDDYEGLEGDVFYTVLDWRNGLRGPCNLIGQSYGDGDYTEADCARMLADFEAGDLEISHRNWVRISFADEVSA